MGMRSAAAGLFGWFGLLGLLGLCGIGCRNACADLCTSLAAYAEECALPVSDAEIDACYERQSDPDDADLQACREFGDPEVIRAQWSCDDLAKYWAG